MILFDCKFNQIIPESLKRSSDRSVNPIPSILSSSRSLRPCRCCRTNILVKLELLLVSVSFRKPLIPMRLRLSCIEQPLAGRGHCLYSTLLILLKSLIGKCRYVSVSMVKHSICTVYRSNFTCSFGHLTTSKPFTTPKYVHFICCAILALLSSGSPAEKRQY